MIADEAAGCVLKIQGLNKSFDGVNALSNINLEVQDGQFFGIIGPNGAGKTTLFNVTSGFLKEDKGLIYLNGEDITKLNTYQRSRKGIARTFQLLRLFGELTVLENVMVGLHHQHKASLAELFLFRKALNIKERTIISEAEDLLMLVGLIDKKNLQSKTLSYGDQRLLEIARALATKPVLLLLDEPAAGMTMSEIEQLGQILTERVRKIAKTIILIEHNVEMVMNLCDRVHVLNFGKTIAECPAKEITENAKVVEAYLGEDDDDDVA